MTFSPKQPNTNVFSYLAIMTTPPVCDYTDSDYQKSFWDHGGREYENRAEAIALKRLLPTNGSLMLELGAGAGRHTARYTGFDRIVLLDYSATQLQQAQERLGQSDRYIFVAADVYHLPFADGLFDAATMIRTLHHMADAPKALGQVGNVMQPGGVFILEYANKLNLKAIFRYWLGRQDWSPFTLDAVEFARLNFDFHPRAVNAWLAAAGFSVEKVRTVSHFRVGLLKRLIPAKILAWVDGLLQWTGALWRLTPSVFVRAVYGRQLAANKLVKGNVLDIFKCPTCGQTGLEKKNDHLLCPSCKSKWGMENGIYDFREPI